MSLKTLERTNTLSTKKILRFTCFVNTIIATLPIVDYYFDWYIRAIPLMILLMFSGTNHKRTVNDMLYTILLSVVILLVKYWATSRFPFVSTMINGVIAWSPAIIAVYVSREEDEKFKKDYLQILTILIAITSLTTIIGLSVYPNASREMASGSAIYDVDKYFRINIGGYDFIYALVVFIPISILMVKSTKRWMKLQNIVCFLLNLYCIYSSGYTIALIVTMLVMVFILTQNHPVVGGICFALFILLLLVDGFIIFASFIEFIRQYVSSEYVADRLKQVEQIFAGLNVSTNTSTARIDHYIQCIDSFLQSPLFGHNFISFHTEHISGHSIVLDMMAGLGLFGISIYSLLYRKMLKFCVIGFRDGIKKTTVALWIAYLLVAILNPSEFILIIFILLVGSVCTQSLDERRIKTIMKVRSEL